MGIKQLSVRRSDTYEVDPSTIIIDKGFNVRIPGPELDEHIRYLADSIKEEGVKEPLTCFIEGDKLHLTSGHCRIKAVEIAKSEGVEILTVPVRLEDRYSKEEDRVLSLITRNSGKSLSQIETGEVFKKLLKYGWILSQIAQKTSYSIQHVSNILTLSGAPTEITDMVKDGKISSTLATDTVNKEGEGAVTVLQEAINGAEVEGKKKATKKDVDKVKGAKKKGIPWKKYGPMLRELATILYDLIPDGDFEWTEIDESRGNLGSLLTEIEEKYGDQVDSGQEQQQLPI